MAEFNVQISQEQLERIRRDIVKAFTPKETPVNSDNYDAAEVLLDWLTNGGARDSADKATVNAQIATGYALLAIHDLLDGRLPSNPGGRPADLSASEAEPAPEGGGDPGAMRDSDLDAIRDRVDRNAYPEGDRARLLAEVDRLREGIRVSLNESRDMQSEVRSSVTLAYLQSVLEELLNQTAGDQS